MMWYNINKEKNKEKMLSHSLCPRELTILLLARVQEFYQIYQVHMNKGLT